MPRFKTRLNKTERKQLKSLMLDLILNMSGRSIAVVFQQMGHFIPVMPGTLHQYIRENQIAEGSFTQWRLSAPHPNNNIDNLRINPAMVTCAVPEYGRNPLGCIEEDMNLIEIFWRISHEFAHTMTYYNTKLDKNKITLDPTDCESKATQCQLDLLQHWVDHKVLSRKLADKLLTYGKNREKAFIPDHYLDAVDRVNNYELKEE